MKKIAFLLLIAFSISACSSTKELSSSRADNRKFRKLAEQAEIIEAVESRRFIIKVDRMYIARGGSLDMVPRSNFVIVNGEIASISLGYMGRSFGVHQITGINLNGRTIKYEMESNEAKGMYKIQMVVKYGSDNFDLYLTIGTNGSCNISLNNSYLSAVSYSGTLVPLRKPNNIPAQKGDRI
ncbi:MAG: hypothetical protein C0408_01490 [Odoribacter sp.]|nr:hypothetical protein [Odoribacter sp.]